MGMWVILPRGPREESEQPSLFGPPRLPFIRLIPRTLPRGLQCRLKRSRGLQRIVLGPQYLAVGNHSHICVAIDSCSTFYINTKARRKMIVTRANSSHTKRDPSAAQLLWSTNSGISRAARQRAVQRLG